MAFADIKRSASAAHKYTFRVSSLDGSTVRPLGRRRDGEGDAMGAGSTFFLSGKVRR